MQYQSAGRLVLHNRLGHWCEFFWLRFDRGRLGLMCNRLRRRLWSGRRQIRQRLFRRGRRRPLATFRICPSLRPRVSPRVPPCCGAIQPEDLGSLLRLLRSGKKPKGAETQRMKQSDSEQISTKKRGGRHRWTEEGLLPLCDFGQSDLGDLS